MTKFSCGLAVLSVYVPYPYLTWLLSPLHLTSLHSQSWCLTIISLLVFVLLISLMLNFLASLTSLLVNKAECCMAIGACLSTVYTYSCTLSPLPKSLPLSSRLFHISHIKKQLIQPVHSSQQHLLGINWDSKLIFTVRSNFYFQTSTPPATAIPPLRDSALACPLRDCDFWNSEMFLSLGLDWIQDNILDTTEYPIVSGIAKTGPSADSVEDRDGGITKNIY